MNKALDRIVVNEETTVKIRNWARENKYVLSNDHLAIRGSKRFMNKELPLLEAQYEWSTKSNENELQGLASGKKLTQTVYFKIVDEETMKGTGTMQVEGSDRFKDILIEYEYNIFEEITYFEMKGWESSVEEFKPLFKEVLSGIILTLIFMAEFREVKEVVSESRVSHVNPNRKKDKNRNRKVVKIGVYHINPNFNTALEKRKFERHAEAWGVRGHWRTYKKSGKRVWVAEHKKGQGEKEGKIYQA